MGGPLQAGIDLLGRKWGWFLAGGIVMLVLGTLALGCTWIATLASLLTFGVMLLIGSAVQIVQAFHAQRTKGFLIHLLVGVLYLLAGLLMVYKPAAAATGFTLILALFFMVGGAFRILVALVERMPYWGWFLLNGVVTFLLGLLIWRQWPASGLWLIGVFVGIDMLFTGWSLVMFSFAARGLASKRA
jgi:uncharacterized membrane protein HdeD (DUF308 family)